ncbi:alpha-N-acetylgalactosaminidase-like [Eriocheir sinensis]|uniref:alpha-N-acetylgalactosaminidase-like n=1 Tax=Eriocheir sinensis TaxID=95602 RepID=UPI0021C80B07|nr:alpha-N-acetylgalactosaminidase-like [Eriocheir sinensis]
MKLLVVVAAVAALWAGAAMALDNGLALTPPMGWLAWERFRCNTDCENDPYNCISQNLMMQMAELMSTDGYLSAGYDVVCLDDCWMDMERDADGRLQPDSSRFPSGIPALADFIHTLGLKFGIYEDFGNKTCAGYPGIFGHLETDANTFAEWGVDYVKLDGCYSTPEEMDEGYPEFGMHLNNTGRPMVYSCSWPDYENNPNYTAIVKTCNLWRNYADIGDSWASVSNIIDHYAAVQDQLAPLAGPGHWNDPDMLIIGNFGLSYDQAKTQMAIWSIMAAPLIMSVDLRDIRPAFKDILLNRRVIAVDQDPLGIQGARISKTNNIEVWSRPVEPVVNGSYSYALAILNRGESTPTQVTLTLKDQGLTSPQGYWVEDLFEGEVGSLVMPDDSFTISVNPSGVVMLRCWLLE